jgi:hypothetical protein
MTACEHDQKDFAQFLLVNGASVNATMDTGWTPAHIAAKKACGIIPSQTYLYGKFKVLNDGKVMHEKDDVALVNFFGMTLFKSCELRANDARISENTSECMSHKNYIEMIASVGADYRNSRAQTSIFHADTGGGPSDMSINNTGYVKRKKLIAGSKECEFVSPTGLDVFTTPKYLPPRSKLGFTFHRNSAKFCHR